MRRIPLTFCAVPVVIAACTSGTGQLPVGTGGGGGAEKPDAGADSGQDSGDIDFEAGTPNGSCAGAVDCDTLGVSCGPMGDGCGGVIQCGDCAAPETCGGDGMPGVCGAPPVCTPGTCATLGASCGPVADGCGVLLDCGTCASPDICGGGGTANVCGGGGGAGSCTNLCLSQVTCPSSGTTTVSGTVYAPNGVDPLYGALVYVPNAPVDPFPLGVSCQQCGADASGSPLVQATTGPDGKFVISNAPIGASIPLVIQLGRWRRQVTISVTAACQDNPVPAGLSRLPRNKGEGDIPFMAFATGGVDALECVLRKIGLDDAEITKPPNLGGSGRVNLYVQNGSTLGPGTPTDSALWSNLATLEQYDMVLFPCEGGQVDKPPVAKQNLLQYLNAGGRVFATHYSYTWFYNTSPFSSAASWHPNQAPFPNLTGYIDMTFPRGQAFAEWLLNVGASTTMGQIPLQTIRHDVDGVFPPSQMWIRADPSLGQGAPMHFTFDTPVGLPPDQQCGRVLYDDFHVEDAPTGGIVFPNECAGGPMTPQEKMLEFMLFDLASCINQPPPPPPPTCTALSCMDQGIGCGPAGDGCGGVIQCGDCTAPDTCGGAGVANQCGSVVCKAHTCQSVGAECGPIGDGCGNILDCGTCTAPETCGGGGLANVCGGTPAK